MLAVCNLINLFFYGDGAHSEELNLTVGEDFGLLSSVRDVKTGDSWLIRCILHHEMARTFCE